jgi:hypothetical protein
VRKAISRRASRQNVTAGPGPANSQHPNERPEIKIGMRWSDLNSRACRPQKPLPRSEFRFDTFTPSSETKERRSRNGCGFNVSKPAASRSIHPSLRNSRSRRSPSSRDFPTFPISAGGSDRPMACRLATCAFNCCATNFGRRMTRPAARELSGGSGQMSLQSCIRNAAPPRQRFDALG